MKFSLHRIFTFVSHNKEFLYKPRGFGNVWDMDDAIIENWNKIVPADADVYVLGDLMLNDNDNGISCIKQLRGNIHIILGNHDTEARIALYDKCWNVVSIEYGGRITYNGWHFFLSHYPTLCGNVDSDKPIYKRTINLCGHVHTADPFADWDKGLIFHCEMDTHNCVPWLLDDIIEQIKIKENLK